MTEEMSDLISTIGKNAAMRKMTRDKNLPKPDMRTLTFAELQILLEKEVQELQEEIFRSLHEPMSLELSRAIQDEAGDVIAFASGIVSKALQIASDMNAQPFLFDDWGRAKDIIERGGTELSADSAE
jgi:hypothetical protein